MEYGGEEFLSLQIPNQLDFLLTSFLYLRQIIALFCHKNFQWKSLNIVFQILLIRFWWRKHFLIILSITNSNCLKKSCIWLKDCEMKTNTICHAFIWLLGSESFSILIGIFSVNLRIRKIFNRKSRPKLLRPKVPVLPNFDRLGSKTHNKYNRACCRNLKVQ